MRRPGPEEWLQLIAEYEGSGLQQKDFVAKHDVSLGTFQYWLYRKSKRASVRLSNSDSKSAPAFVPLEVVASPALQARQGTTADLVEVALPSGARVRFSVGTDPGYLAALLAALR